MKIAKLATKVSSSGGGKIKGIANSLTMTRSGIRVTQDAGKSVVGQTVPLLLSHDWDKPSIGSVTMTGVDKEGLHYEGHLFENAPDRDLLLEGIEAGTNYVSIGFGVDNIDSDGNIDSIDLLELSLTSTPADSKATAEVIKQALEENEKMADEPQNPQDSQNPADKKEPTLQDVLDALSAFKADVDKELKAISGAVVPTNGDKADEKDPEDKPADDTEKQALEAKNAKLMSFMDKIDVQSLTFDEYMTFRDLQK